MIEELKRAVKRTDEVFSCTNSLNGLVHERVLINRALLNQVVIMNALTAMCNKLVEIDGQIQSLKQIMYNK